MSSGVKKNETEVLQRSLPSSLSILTPLEEDKTLLETDYKSNPEPNINKIDKYQQELSFIAIILILLLNKFEFSHLFASKFLILQNKYTDSEAYDIGLDDGYFVIYWIFIVTFIRALVINYFLGPIATNVFNIHGHKNIQRFKEQGWYSIYYSTSFAFGAYLYFNSPYFANLDNLYIDWPHDKMNSLFKKYYLIELACWLQQIFILNIEAKRKDHIQMFSHHIITCSLIIGSYYYYFTRIGNVILVMMDFVDIIFALAKIFKYLGKQMICDTLFLLFVTSWIVLRHGVYNYILYHTATKATSLMEPGRCIAGVIQKRCYTDNIIRVFVSLLGGLQIITIIWMYLIIKVVVKVITGNGAEDVRSDDEE